MKEKAPAPTKTQGAEGTQIAAKPRGEFCQLRRRNAIDRLRSFCVSAMLALHGVIFKMMLPLAVIFGGLGR